MPATAKLAVRAFYTDLYVTDGRSKQHFNVLTGPGEDFPEDAPTAADRMLTTHGYRRTSNWAPSAETDPRLPEWTATIERPET